MEELIKWIIENKELALLACVTISISVPISVRFGKTVINNNIRKNRTIYNYENSMQKQNKSKTKSRNPGTSVIKYQNTSENMELTEIRLYSTGKKGKVYTTTFYKTMNHNFGIEVTLKNNTPMMQNVKVGWCIYKDGEEKVKGTFNKKVNANASRTIEFFVKQQTFNNLMPGKYKSQFWVNDKRVQKVYFTIMNK